MELLRGKDQEFGNHLRKLREARGLTQEALAARSSLSVDAVRRVEYGTFSPSLKTIRKLAHGLDVSLRTLFRSFANKRRRLLEELCDFLGTRPDRDINLAWRVIHAMFNPKSGSTHQI